MAKKAKKKFPWLAVGLGAAAVFVVSKAAGGKGGEKKKTTVEPDPGLIGDSKAAHEELIAQYELEVKALNDNTYAFITEGIRSGAFTAEAVEKHLNDWDGICTPLHQAKAATEERGDGQALVSRYNAMINTCSSNQRALKDMFKHVSAPSDPLPIFREMANQVINIQWKCEDKETYLNQWLTTAGQNHSPLLAQDVASGGPRADEIVALVKGIESRCKDERRYAGFRASVSQLKAALGLS